MTGTEVAAILDHLAAGRVDAAGQAATGLLARCPDAPAAWHLAGVVARGRGDHQAAVRLFGQALELKPDHAPVLADLGLAQLTLGRPDQARQSLERALVLQPARAEILLNLATAVQFSRWSGRVTLPPISPILRPNTPPPPAGWPQAVLAGRSLPA